MPPRARGVLGALPLAALLTSGGCATDWGVRGSPFEGLGEGLGEGLVAIGAWAGMHAGLGALQRAGGDPGNGSEYLFRPEHEWSSSGW